MNAEPCALVRSFVFGSAQRFGHTPPIRSMASWIELLARARSAYADPSVASVSPRRWITARLASGDDIAAICYNFPSSQA